MFLIVARAIWLALRVRYGSLCACDMACSARAIWPVLRVRYGSLCACDMARSARAIWLALRVRYGSLCAFAIHPIHSHSSLRYREIYKSTTTCQRLPQFMHTTPQKCENGFFIYMVRPTVHTNPSWKRSFLETLFKPEEFENAGFVF